MLARNLLTDDGVIFISIDDNEQANLKKICDEIFGEMNFIQNFLWNKNSGGTSLSKFTRSDYEYIFCFARNIGLIKKEFVGKISEGMGDSSLINQPNKYLKLVFPANSISFTNDSIGRIKSFKGNDFELHDDLVLENGFNSHDVSISAKWKWSQSKLDEEISAGTKILSKSKDLRLRYMKNNAGSVIKPTKSISPNDGVGFTVSGSSELRDLFNLSPFDFPKPSSLILYLINMVTFFSSDSIILDFFSGSGTTAHAVMKLNAEDGGNRKFIMVQLPEKSAEDSEAYKAGYKNICEIGKERIRRAGEKVKQETLKKDSADVGKLDIGFKVFKLDSTNIKPWDGTQDVQQSLLEASGNVVKQDRTDLDVVHELMLKYGVFNEQIQEAKINGKTLYSIGNNFLVVCLFKTITKQDVETIIKLKPKNVIFNDAGFKDDNVKINAELSLKNNGVEDIKSL
jgi:adenine-specific DNA-methyltransferase